MEMNTPGNNGCFFGGIEHTETGEEILRPWEGSAIILMDLDAFFASVEQLDHPQWRGKPVIVGGSPQTRGVVSTASYEARPYGVRSGMPSVTAASLCPDAIWTPGHFSRYRELSKAVMNILYEESPWLMQVSIDEAFLDVSPTRANTTHPVVVARRIQARVAELGITCSIGLGASKSVAKIASEQRKPRGLYVVHPQESEAFLAPLPIRAMSGIGPAAQDKLQHYGIHTLGELARADLSLLKNVFGKNAELMAQRARGIDTPVESNKQPAKSISSEISFAQNISTTEEVCARIAAMAHKVGRRLRTKGMEGTTLHLKVRFDDLTVKTCQHKMANLGTNDLSWLPTLYSMLGELWHEGQELRLVGVGVSGFEHELVQTRLFDESPAEIPSQVALPTASDHQSKTEQKLLEAEDAIAQRFGEDAVRFGYELRSYNNTTGSAPKNPQDYKD